mgnify:CR=1 FL=1
MFRSFLALLGATLVSASVLAGPYLDQPPPGAEPRIFAPGLVSDGLNNRDLAITPDGVVEPDETIVLGIDGTPSDVTVGDANSDSTTQSGHTYTILDDDSLTVEFDGATASDTETSGGNLPQLLVSGQVQAVVYQGLFQQVGRPGHCERRVGGHGPHPTLRLRGVIVDRTKCHCPTP